MWKWEKAEFPDVWDFVTPTIDLRLLLFETGAYYVCINRGELRQLAASTLEVAQERAAELGLKLILADAAQLAAILL